MVPMPMFPFALKDDEMQLEGVIVMGSDVKIQISSSIRGKNDQFRQITIFLRSSKYQIFIEALEATGVGVLATLFIKSKKEI
ncbi:exodeoxyribonuclease VII large subunit [Bartonella tribocorum]|uniref:Exodeoxyribonuclease VII large subunit n=1 Tax=Bartonella tribocorum (strain DSM 28219 / CCUG 45778 / CIP 105476 / IBS 506) TaxID=382640 RepID=A9IXA8_BART1